MPLSGDRSPGHSSNPRHLSRASPTFTSNGRLRRVYVE
jgi:hypothetical protein